MAEQPMIDTATRDRLRQVLEDELAHVQSPDQAEAVLQHAEALAAGASEEQVARSVAASPLPAVAGVQKAAETTPKAVEPAAVLVEAAAQAVAPTDEAPAVVEAAREVVGTAHEGATVRPAAQRGRDLLKEAVLRRMGPFQGVDARLFLLVNRLPHPPHVDEAIAAITLITTGGWVWIGGALVGAGSKKELRQRVLTEILPAVALSTWVVEHPIKAYFRRKRPFIDIVRALVVGKKPGSWSFPSGHTASAFASALALSAVWRRQSPLFYALAGGIGFSRVYAGAHYPGDVLAGATLGTLFCAAVRWVARRVLT